MMPSSQLLEIERFTFDTTITGTIDPSDNLFEQPLFLGGTKTYEPMEPDNRKLATDKERLDWFAIA